MGPEAIAQIIVNVLMLSSMYILVALGFALILSVLDVLNFGHAAIYTVGGYICYQLTVVVGVNQWVSLLISMMFMGFFGLVLERFCFRPFLNDKNRIIVITLALIVILTATVNVTVGSYIKRVPAFATGVLRLGDVTLSGERLATFIIGAVLLASVILFIKKTRTGLQMLAIAQDIEGAALQGIRTNRIAAVTTALGCALAAVAGSLMGAVLSLSPFMGDLMLVKAIEIVVLGGIGSVGGVLVGGLILGTIDATLPIYISGYATELIGLGVIIVLLLFRPRGLFGREAT
ncbi:branched-chain amino acid ABC transporter permease [bacterium]|nr:branched-chain amino acid ABC transporter permease [bacterium]